MLISELPQPYKALAEKRREEYYNDEPSEHWDDLRHAFMWYCNDESDIYFDFWADVHEAKTESELPPYPYE